MHCVGYLLYETRGCIITDKLCFTHVFCCCLYFRVHYIDGLFLSGLCVKNFTSCIQFSYWCHISLMSFLFVISLVVLITILELLFPEITTNCLVFCAQALRYLLTDIFWNFNPLLLHLCDPYAIIVRKHVLIKSDLQKKKKKL